MKKPKLSSMLFKSAGLLLLLLIVVSSCKKDDPAPVKQKADFAKASDTVVEDAGVATVVTINFGAAVTEASGLTVTIANSTGVAYTTDYVTNPNGSSGSITLDIASGASQASFTVTPIDDTEENDAKVITFTLSAATGGLVLGTATTYTFTIADNDVPGAVNFTASSSTVAENAGAAHTINLTLGSALVNAGSFDVTITSADATYTTHYTTDPDGTSGSFTINLAAAATASSFTVTPVDNGDDEPDKTITFTIANATGGVSLGTSTTHALTIIGDDNPTLKTIAEIRALYSGTDVPLNDNWTITGTVTSKIGSVTAKNLFIQDATAGIVVRWNDDNTFDNGDELTIRLLGSTISDFNELVQIGGTMPLTNATVNSTGNVVTAKAVTFAELNTGDHQAQLVKVQNVTFASADGLVTVSGNNTGNDGVTDAAMRVESYATFSGDALPIGTGIVEGLAGTFGSTAQILPQAPGDIFDNAPTSTINIIGTLTDFGVVATGANSVSQSFGVSGSSLAEDITVTAPDQFEVSLEASANFSSSVIVTKTAAEAGVVDVYVRFSPTTGFDNTHDGNVVSVTAGAVSQNVAVTGIEDAPGGSSLLFADDFDYGSTAGPLVNGNTADGVGAATWSAHSGGTSSTQVGYITTSLSMTNYPSTGVGGSATIAGSGEDINATFADQTSGTVYLSALVEISAVSDGSYFFHVKDGGTSNLRGRVGAKTDGTGGILFGIGASSSSLTYGATSFALNTTYLIVASYNIDSGVSNLYVLTAVSPTEPGTPEATNTGTLGNNILAVAMREGTTSGAGTTPDAIIDGVRVATDWAGIMTN